MIPLRLIRLFGKALHDLIVLVTEVDSPNYLVPNYKVLHTLGSGTVTDDIELYLSPRGVEVSKNHGGHR